MVPVVVSSMDVAHLAQIRGNVNAFLRRVSATYAVESGLLLDIAPQVHEGARPFFSPEIDVETFDLDPNSGCTHVGDICKLNPSIPAGRYDYVVCTEVLEHTLQPFGAADELRRILRIGGWLFMTTPFNFRIHGPLPDCWRFTEHGLRAVLNGFEIVEMSALETPGRDLMPIHYTVVARRP